MIIVVDVAVQEVRLDEPGAFDRFSVDVRGPADQQGVTELVGRTGIGRMHEDGAHLVVDPTALRTLAGGAVDAEWEHGFGGMVAYAAGKGWVEEDGGILGHLEWRDA